MPKRKVIVEIDLNDDQINSIEDLEKEILAQDLYGQVARKYLHSLQDDTAQYVNSRKGSKNVQIKRYHFEFDFQPIFVTMKLNHYQWTVLFLKSVPHLLDPY